MDEEAVRKGEFLAMLVDLCERGKMPTEDADASAALWIERLEALMVLGSRHFDRDLKPIRYAVADAPLEVRLVRAAGGNVAPETGDQDELEDVRRGRCYCRAGSSGAWRGLRGTLPRPW